MYTTHNQYRLRRKKFQILISGRLQLTHIFKVPRLFCVHRVLEMEINLEINETQINEPQTCNTNIHYVPASIQGDGPAKVDMFFNAYTVKEDGILRNSFRGYPLSGCEFPLPAQFKGLIFQETECRLDENAKRAFKFAGSFDSINYWNYDRIPSKADPFRQMFDVMKVSDALCEDIPLEDIEKKIEERKKA